MYVMFLIFVYRGYFIIYGVITVTNFIFLDLIN